MWSQSFLVIVLHNCGIQFWLVSVRLTSLWVPPVLIRRPWLTEPSNASSLTCLVVNAGYCQRSELSCGQDTYMGCFQVAWPSSQCCAKLRNHRHHLSSSITVDSHKGPGRNSKITCGWEILLWFSLQNISSQVFPILSFRFMMFCFLFTPFSSP